MKNKLLQFIIIALAPILFSSCLWENNTINNSEVSLKSEIINENLESKEMINNSNLKENQILLHGKSLLSYNIWINKDNHDWDYLKFHNEELGISFQYPKHWWEIEYSVWRKDGVQFSPLRESFNSLWIMENIEIFKVWFKDSRAGFLFYKKDIDNKYLELPLKQFRENVYVEFNKNKKDVCSYNQEFLLKNNRFWDSLGNIQTDCENNIKMYHIPYIYKWGPYKYLLVKTSFLESKLSSYPNLIIQDIFYWTTDKDKTAFEDIFTDWSIIVDNVKEFGNVVSSVKISTPKPVEKVKFQINENQEDKNIQKIEQYYSYISTWDYFNAAKLKHNSSIEQLQELYSETYIISPYDFKKIKANEYEFYVKFQEFNKDVKTYIVNMEVQSEHLITKSSKYVPYETKFNEALYARIIENEEKKLNSLILYNAWEEKNILTSFYDYNDNNNDYEYWYIKTVNFSNSWKYFTYRKGYWESSSTVLWLVQDWNILDEFYDAENSWFTFDDNYFYASAKNDFSGAYYLIIYDIKKWRDLNIYHKIELIAKENHSNIDYINLNYLKDKNILEITYNKSSNDIAFYNFETGKVFQ